MQMLPPVAEMLQVQGILSYQDLGLPLDSCWFDTSLTVLCNETLQSQVPPMQASATASVNPPMAVPTDVHSLAHTYNQW